MAPSVSLPSPKLTYLDSDVQAFRLLGPEQLVDLQAAFNHHRDDALQLLPLHLPQGQQRVTLRGRHTGGSLPALGVRGLCMAAVHKPS